MKFLTRICLVSTLLLPILASAGEWSKEQQEVLKFEKACLLAQTADNLMGCFHEDYTGWGQDYQVPLSKADRRSSVVYDFSAFDRELMVFKPLSVIVKGNMAVISYIESDRFTNKTTKEVSFYTGRWTDVCIKENGKWTWIADHGVNISGD